MKKQIILACILMQTLLAQEMQLFFTVDDYEQHLTSTASHLAYLTYPICYRNEIGRQHFQERCRELMTSIENNTSTACFASWSKNSLPIFSYRAHEIDHIFFREDVLATCNDDELAFLFVVECLRIEKMQSWQSIASACCSFLIPMGLTMFGSCQMFERYFPAKYQLVSTYGNQPERYLIDTSQFTLDEKLALSISATMIVGGFSGIFLYSRGVECYFY